MRPVYLIALLAMMGLAGCADSSLPTLPMRDGEAINRMGGEIGDQFEFKSFEIEQGTTLRFEHLGGSQHNVLSRTGAWPDQPPSLNDFVLDTSNLEPGDYEFFCNPHQNVGMQGTFRVVEA